jgi:hypothetical protein
MSDDGTALLAYYTRDFNNYATAKLFTPLRDEIRRENAAKNKALRTMPESAAARQPWLASYALRGNTALRKGHSLDFVDFYRWADNAFVFETTNRDPRTWGWTSQLTDLQRLVQEHLGTRSGVYVKPHRGAPVQRALSAISRGSEMLYWYTYGPLWAKGDSFARKTAVEKEVVEATALLRGAETRLHLAKDALQARVALLRPETSQRWMNLSGNPSHLRASWENGKWIYTALQHANYLVDPLDETLAGTVDLSIYKVIFVAGTHLRKDTLARLRDYVAAGGILYTSALGLSRDEANRPSALAQRLLGLKRRVPPSMYSDVRLYGGGRLGRPAVLTSSTGALTTNSLTAGMPLAIGIESLLPRRSAETVARFSDGSPAIVRNRVGAGYAYTAGFFGGLEYAAPILGRQYNMATDPTTGARDAVVGVIGSPPQVQVSATAVEARLLKSPSGQHSLILINWAHAKSQRTAPARLVSRKDVVIKLPAMGLSRAYSRALGSTLEVTNGVDGTQIRVPQIGAGDVVELD